MTAQLRTSELDQLLVSWLTGLESVCPRELLVARLGNQVERLREELPSPARGESESAEEWKPLDYDPLEISNRGRVRWILDGEEQLVEPETFESGRLFVDGKTGFRYWIHDQVYRKFVGPVTSDDRIGFLDGDPTNCSVENLRLDARWYGNN